MAAAATPADTTPPSVPTGLVAQTSCAGIVTLTWNSSTDDVGVIGYDIYHAPARGTFTLLGVSTITRATESLGGQTQYQVRARDAAGNVSAFSSIATAYPLGCPIPPPSPTPPSTGDVTPPSVPTGLGYRINCNLDFTLEWTRSTDNIGVAGYDIYKAPYGSSTFTSAGTSATITFADHLGSYNRYQVRARDYAGNVSAFTAPVTIVPPPCPTMPPTSSPPSTTPPATGDSQPPTTPGTPTATVSCGVANLTWTASTDNVNVLRYEVWRASGTATNATFELAGTVPTTTFTHTGPGSYQFKVRASDAANNYSAFSAPVAVYVPACPTSSSPSTGCTAAFSVISSWSSGFQGQVLVTNTGTTATTSWTVTLTFDSGQKITQIWNARTSSTASPYAITNESYNGALAPGATATFGFLGTGPGISGSATTATCTRTP
ncbi:hypothetical protein GCM10009682_18740 [Luedemannella flava]|uniref:Uncharacterized protein n=2 Tax=Luedemannella flava TaxID=349316 RepID=A0ABP4Y1X8_9ACTN